MAAPIPCAPRAAIKIVDVGASAQSERSDRKYGEAGHKLSFGTQAIAQGASGQDQRGEGNRVGADDPLQLDTPTPNDVPMLFNAALTMVTSS
jgi:hypothetical protein